MWQYKIPVYIEKTSYQLVLLFRGDELPRRHGAQDLYVRFVSSVGGQPHPDDHYVVTKHPSEAQPYMAEASSSSSTSSSGRSSTSDEAEFCAVLSAKGPLLGFLACKYVYCSMLLKHARIYCPKINLWCFDCLHRGHAASDKVCKAKDTNLTIFEEAANLGIVTP
jgi:hypothetical protein